MPHRSNQAIFIYTIEHCTTALQIMLELISKQELFETGPKMHYHHRIFHPNRSSYNSMSVQIVIHQGQQAECVHEVEYDERNIILTLLTSQTVASFCIWAIMCVRNSHSFHHPPRGEINITYARWEGLLHKFIHFLCFYLLCLISCFNVLFSLVLSCVMAFLTFSCFVLLPPCCFS